MEEEKVIPPQRKWVPQARLQPPAPALQLPFPAVLQPCALLPHAEPLHWLFLLPGQSLPAIPVWLAPSHQSGFHSHFTSTPTPPHEPIFTIAIGLMLCVCLRVCLNGCRVQTPNQSSVLIGAQLSICGMRERGTQTCLHQEGFRRRVSQSPGRRQGEHCG